MCVPSDTQLRLEGIPEALQNKFGVGPYEEVTFVHLDHGRYRDGIKFRNGAEITLQQLEPGITAVVIMSLERTMPATSTSICLIRKCALRLSWIRRIRF